VLTVSEGCCCLIWSYYLYYYSGDWIIVAAWPRTVRLADRGIEQGKAAAAAAAAAGGGSSSRLTRKQK
jgi:hypothetical protein